MIKRKVVPIPACEMRWVPSSSDPEKLTKDKLQIRAALLSINEDGKLQVEQDDWKDISYHFDSDPQQKEIKINISFDANGN